MAKFVFSYSGGDGKMPETEDEMNELMAAWGGWFESLGAAVLDALPPQ